MYVSMYVCMYEIKIRSLYIKKMYVCMCAYVMHIDEKGIHLLGRKQNPIGSVHPREK